MLYDDFHGEQHPFQFAFHVEHSVAKPRPAPLIPDDDNYAFSHYIAHDLDRRPPPSASPSTPSLASSLSSAGPVSASAFPLFNAHSSYSELHGFTTYAPQAQPQPQKPDTKRLSGACTRCKKMKMKCEFREADPTCQRCKAGKYDCVVEGRKPRTPSQREWLLAQIRQKDALIATLLRAASPHSHPTPLTLATTKLRLSPAERALNWSDKGGGAADKGRWRLRWKERQRGEEEEEWSSESDESEDAWDGEVERALLSKGAQISKGGETPKRTDKGEGAGMYAHALPAPSAPFGMIARLSLEMGREEGAKGVGVKRGAEVLEEGEEEEEEEWGIANGAYFEPGPAANLALRRVLNERETPPAIIASGLISWKEAERLFDVFYKYINPYMSVLDPVLHTASSVFERCPFLFTVVCAITLRHTPPSSLHKLAMHLAKTAAGTALIDGFKSVEMVQAYFLLGSYGVPARRWEEDRSWFYGGLAGRIATDLSLHRATHTKPLSERHARELLNRVRTWLIVFNVDRSSSTQWGKPSGLCEDEVIRGAGGWYRGSEYNHPYDLHLVAYTELLRIMSRFHEQINSYARAPRGLHKSCNFKAITEATEAEIGAWHDDQQWKYTHESDPNDPGSVFRTKGLPVFENYMRLVMYSFGFQDAWNRRGVEPGDMFFAKCLSAASAVVRQLIEVYGPSGYLKYAPDCYFVMGGFCSAFLLKMLRPEFSALLDEAQRVRIVELVERFVDVLASPAAAIDEAHTPMLYARFLRGQLKHVSGPGRPAPAPAALASSSSPTSLHNTHTSDVPPLCAPSPSSAGSSVPTPGPDAQVWFDTWSASGSGSGTAAPEVGMELCEEEQLASMQAVMSEQWYNSIVMPGFKLPEVVVDEGMWFPT